MCPTISVTRTRLSWWPQSRRNAAAAATASRSAGWFSVEVDVEGSAPKAVPPEPQHATSCPFLACCTKHSSPQYSVAHPLLTRWRHGVIAGISEHTSNPGSVETVVSFSFFKLSSALFGPSPLATPSVCLIDCVAASNTEPTLPDARSRPASMVPTLRWHQAHAIVTFAFSKVCALTNGASAQSVSPLVTPLDKHNPLPRVGSFSNFFTNTGLLSARDWK
mmetsp:Transcript_3330/g.12381  ORF Transcript_3330/g.12381 Transcript_3330/m.12381 type:complete len:220 (-) Transcript_3330:716-1375(-)